MGRQLQVAVTAGDALALAEFVHENSASRIFRNYADSPDEILIDAVSEASFGDAFDILIWPMEFAWQPKYMQTCGPAQQRKWYISNSSAAPLLEFGK